MTSIQIPDLELTKLLLKYGANVNAPMIDKEKKNTVRKYYIITDSFKTLLHIASEEDHLDAVTLLLLHGADVFAVVCFYITHNNN